MIRLNEEIKNNINNFEWFNEININAYVYTSSKILILFEESHVKKHIT